MSKINIIEISKMLISKTESKKATWNKASGQDQYTILLDNGSITIWRYDDEDGANVIISILNSNYDEIYKERFDERNNDPNLINLLKDLHTAAKNSYFKVEETIEGILGEISSQEAIGRIEESDEPEDDGLPF